MIWLRHVRAIDRRAAWPVAILLGLWVASIAHPMTWETVYRTSQALPLIHPDVYSELHARPFRYCDSYAEQRKSALARIDQAVRGSFFDRVDAYNFHIRQHYAEDCRTPWRPYENPAKFQAYFAQSYSLYFAVGILGLSEIHLAIAAIAVQWLGVVAFAILCVWCWRSTLAPVAGFLIASALLSASFARLVAVPLPAPAGVLVAPGQALYPLVTALLVAAMMALLPRDMRPWRRSAFWILPAAFGVHGLLYVLIDPPVARMFVWVALAFSATMAVLWRRWALLACTVLAGVASSAVWQWYAGPAHEIYAVVTGYDHLSSEAYAPFMMYMGLLERPSWLGLFYMDEVFAWGIQQDPLTGTLAPSLAVHQSYAHVSRQLLADVLTGSPWTMIDAYVRRLLVQVFYRPLWYVWEIRVDWVYTGMLLAGAAVNALAVLFRRWWTVLTPVSLGVLVTQFALDTSMTLMHTHPRWNQLGVLLMFGAAPVYLFAAVSMVARRHEAELPSRLRGGLPRRLVVPLLAVAIALLAAGGAWASALLEDEVRNVQTWMRVHQPGPGGLDLDAVLVDIDERRRESGDQDGRLAMWAASIIYMIEVRSPGGAGGPDETRVRRTIAEEEVSRIASDSIWDGTCWRVLGDPAGPFSYLLASRQTAVEGAHLRVEGELAAGGLSIGLQAEGRWISSQNVTTPGRFSVNLHPALEGPVEVVIANNQTRGSGSTAACIETMEWREPTPGALSARRRGSLRERRVQYVREALAAAPDNPNFPYYARFLQLPNWEAHLLDAVRRFPESPYAAGALAALWYAAPPDSPDIAPAAHLYRVDLARRFEAALAGFLRATGSGNPMFVPTPAVTQTAGGDVLTSIASADGRQLTRLRLAPRTEAWLSPQPTWGSHFNHLVAYVHVVSGQAQAGLSLSNGSTRRVEAPVEVTPESQLSGGRYLRFQVPARPDDRELALWIAAGDDGAVVDVADVYPMLTSPTGYYQSLLERGADGGAASRLGDR